ncbi:MAG: hypothetical protein KGY68_08315 [Candidatus Thermoplasmatota archaeon]|nr:hypothetical protein [Candidatus Thermoplasmatota archaeon]
MLESVKSRTAIVVILLLLLLSLFIWYGSLSPAPDKGRFPGNDELVEDYERYKGKKVEVGGEVIETDPVMIEVESGDMTIELKIADLQERPEKGDRLTVFGTAGGNNTIHSKNALIRSSWRYAYMYGISIVGAVWIGLRLIGQWRFDKENLAFEAREEPLTVLETLSHLKGSDSDG